MGTLNRFSRLFGGTLERSRRIAVSALANDARLDARGLPALRNESQRALDMKLAHSELKWLHDPARITARRAPHCRLILRRKKDGSFRPVLTPTRCLEAVQTWILRNVPARVPRSNHAPRFAPGRPIATRAAAHIGKRIVLHADLKDFFRRFAFRSVTQLFRSFGYPGDGTRTLALLCTVPIWEVLPTWAGRIRYRTAELRHVLRAGFVSGMHPTLPQDAPTIPAISNLLRHPLDARLACLAAAFEAPNTRRDDDLAFSGKADFRCDLRRFMPLLQAILRVHRLPLAPRTPRFARTGSRRLVVGLVVNRNVNVPAESYRKLRAILYNRDRIGSDAQNPDRVTDVPRRLQARLAFVASFHPERGEQRKESFAHNAW